jgi:hypothetical protein
MPARLGPHDQQVHHCCTQEVKYEHKEAASSHESNSF